MEIKPSYNNNIEIEPIAQWLKRWALTSSIAGLTPSLA